ncbi:hypothetical protein V2J09_021042 [Rumex salicifolius]
MNSLFNLVAFGRVGYLPRRNSLLIHFYNSVLQRPHKSYLATSDDDENLPAIKDFLDLSSRYVRPTLAQLVERRTVVGGNSCRKILRSLVRIRQVLERWSYPKTFKVSLNCWPALSMAYKTSSNLL